VLLPPPYVGNASGDGNRIAKARFSNTTIQRT
jgi:hypothetical protein